MEFEKDHKNILLVLLVCMIFGITLYIQEYSDNKRFDGLEERVYNLENDKDLSNQKINNLKGDSESQNTIIIESVTEDETESSELETEAELELEIQ